MEKAIVVLWVILVVVSSFATQPRNKKNSHEQRPNNVEKLSASQETIDDLCIGAKNRPEEVRCFLTELKKSDRIMNALIDEYIAKFKLGSGSITDLRYAKKQIANLLSTQRAWLSYREKNCKAEQDLYGEGREAEVSGVIC